MHKKTVSLYTKPGTFLVEIQSKSFRRGERPSRSFAGTSKIFIHFYQQSG